MKQTPQLIVAETSEGAAATIGMKGLASCRPDPRYRHENAWIAERLRARDPQILDQLILQYQHRLMRYLLYLTGNRELAEDLFQETWMRVLQRGSQFRGNSQFIIRRSDRHS